MPGGRPKGAPNKTSVTVKDAMLGAAAAYRAGGKEGLQGFCEHIRDNEPIEFFKALAKMLPRDMNIEAGDKVLAVIERRFVKREAE